MFEFQVNESGSFFRIFPGQFGGLNWVNRAVESELDLGFRELTYPTKKKLILPTAFRWDM